MSLQKINLTMQTKSQYKQAIKVFMSYSHKDEKLLIHLQKHLDILKKQCLITTWHDRRITAGQEWKNVIDKNLMKADIILLLVSPDFISSEYCFDVEVQLAMKRHKNNEARVIPIILRPVDWQNTLIGSLQSLPKDGRPVVNWKNRDEAFLNITNGIRLAVQELINSTNEKNIIYSKDIERTPIKKKVKWLLVLSATVDEIDKSKAEAIVEHLRKLSGDLDLTLLKVESGSVKIYLEGNENGFERIKSLLKSQNLVSLCGFEILEMRLENVVDSAGTIAEYENRLITNFQLGNFESANELISHYIDRITQVVKKHIGEYKNDWQDVVHDIILKLLDKIRQGQIQAERLPAYLVTLIRQETRKYQARYTRPSVNFMLADRLENILEQARPTEELLKAIEEAIDTLDYKYKQILYLRFFDQLTVRQIAEKLQLTDNEVYHRIYRARKLLSKEIIRRGLI